jgi:3-deoxy-D-manno-octulosonate 8-phosphate phosphatase (KDO 8-P phosphatase)
MALSPRRRARFGRVRLLILDVDGVLTDAGMYYSERGDELKKFNTRDGHGIRLLQDAGIRTAIVTREETAIVARRAAKLRIEDVHQGILDKLPVVKALCEKHGVTADEACYVGDDLGDLEAMSFVGLPVAVRDAMRPIKRVARYVTRRRGGDGAVREVCDLILAARTHRGTAREAIDVVKRMVRPIVPAALRRALVVARTPAAERYTPDDLGRVRSVTTRHWRAAAERSSKYVADYWGHADDEALATRARRRSEWLVSLPPFAEAKSVMELGCAAGRNLYVLQQRRADVALYGADINADAVAHARSRVRGDFVVGDLYETGRLLEGREVDGIFTMGVLIHLHPRALPELIREMARHARRWLLFCEEISADDAVVKGPAWWRPSRKVTGEYIQWSPNLPRVLRDLGLTFEVADVPKDLQGNGARHLVTVRLG